MINGIIFNGKATDNDSSKIIYTEGEEVLTKYCKEYQKRTEVIITKD